MALRAVVFDLNGVIVEELDWPGGRTPRMRDGICALIAELSHAGVLLAIATAGRRVAAEQTIARLGLKPHFRAVVGLEDVRLPKPDPEVYRQALARLDVAPHEAVAIEDSPRGIRAARAAGLTAVAVPADGNLKIGFGEAHLVADSPADLDLATLSALVERLQR